MTTRSPMLIVRVDDREIAQADVRAIRSLKLTHAERKADTGTLVFRDPEASIFDSRMYRKGAELTIVMGWNNDLESRGPYVVKSQKINFPENGEAELTVEFQDRSHAMNRQQRRRRFANQTPARIIQQIASEYGLGYEIEEPNNVEFTDDRPLLQANITDARLLQRLAERYGYVWGVEGGNLYFRRPVDLETLGQQSSVPILSYRINDWSLRSFSPQVKFNNGRRRRGARNTSSNVDLTNGTSEDNGIFQILRAGRNVVESALPQLSEVLRVGTGQDSDDDEQEASTETTAQRPRGRRRVDRIRTTLGEEIFQSNTESAGDVDENEESEPGDESGAATADSEDEAERRASARVARASEIVEGTAIPSIASMRWRPQMAVVLAGVGERLSGRYRVVEVTHTISGDFQTSLKLKRQTFRPSSTDSNQIADASADASEGGGESSSEGQPAPTTREEQRYHVDRVRTRLGRRFTVNREES